MLRLFSVLGKQEKSDDSEVRRILLGLIVVAFLCVYEVFAFLLHTLLPLERGLMLLV